MHHEVFNCRKKGGTNRPSPNVRHIIRKKGSALTGTTSSSHIWFLAASLTICPISRKGKVWLRILIPFSLDTAEGCGMLRSDIIAACDLTSGGKVSDILEALEKSDLIKPYNNFGETRRNTYYRLSDPFCLFYLNFARKNPTGNTTFWQDNLNSPKLNAWRGLAFEDVCFVHQKEIRTALGIRKHLEAKAVPRLICL